MPAALIRLAFFLAIVWLAWRMYRRLRENTPRPPASPPLRLITPERSPYEILGLPEGAPMDAVRAARDRLLRENHPDPAQHPEVRKVAERVCREVEDAYERLTDH